jgi:hypothetical protein
MPVSKDTGCLLRAIRDQNVVQILSSPSVNAKLPDKNKSVSSPLRRQAL